MPSTAKRSRRRSGQQNCWFLLAFALGSSACSSPGGGPASTAPLGSGAATTAGGSTGNAGQPSHGGAPAAAGSGGALSSGGGTGGGASTLPMSVTVHLVPEAGVSGAQRVNFAVPLGVGQLSDATKLRVLSAGQEVPIFTRGLARYADQSLRSVQIQLDQAEAAEADVVIELGQSATLPALELVPVEQTLLDPNGQRGPRVWAVLPANWLSGSGFAGPLLPEADVAGQPSAAWAAVCDYEANDVAAFLASDYETDRAVWLFDRGTALYRGYARRGELGPLRSAYIETSMYRNCITGAGAAARNGIGDDAADDVKYNYTQNLALHYLLSGDDRFRESAEALGLAMMELWPSPGYAGGDDFWTERHAGFALLAYDWAMIVSDDHAPEFRAAADAAIDAYLTIQSSYPAGHADDTARCFAHTANAHGEDGAYFGCSPWMSAILADGMVQYAAESSTERAALVQQSLVKLGRLVAQSGIQTDGRPKYFMGVDSAESMVEEYDEHYGESAYLVGMSWYFSGKSDAALRDVADQLMAKLASDGSAPHIRSFNWQCRSAVTAPWYLR